MLRAETVLVRAGDPREPGALACLQASHALMESLFPPEDNHYLSVDALRVPGISFFVAEDDGAILGTIALARKDGYGEVKSMFVDPAARGRGVARALLDHVEGAARGMGLPLLRLETGNLLEAAIALYEAQGFRRCGAFGDYVVNGTSVIMEKPLG
ncbi:MAG: GNAT family N-acetyltransferase [Rhodobacterales bacterium]|nr:GNAT family N-acetyltransferase [Rhodobacterales bacterium]MDX5413644.1 GNAT family N-acetyltransferase [Rhodobacterales bacterium]